MEKVDFVLPWVDGSDPLWLAEKNKYSDYKVNSSASSAVSRYRDWDNLQYWFRGVEKYAPWVNNIFFITWGHLPGWLNLQHPKLRIVKHEDFIPKKYLPTFNSNARELNLHSIRDLSEHFVIFNDDTFIINKTNLSDFFNNQKPVDQFIMNPIISSPNLPIIGHTGINNLRIINKNFYKKRVIKDHFGKIYSPNYGGKIFRNLILSFWPLFVGFYNPHLPLPHLKSTLELLWGKEYESFDMTCSNKFRQFTDINHWVLRYWNLCTGNFSPGKSGMGKVFIIGQDDMKIFNYLENQNGKIICINDTSYDIDFEEIKKEINQRFIGIFSEKSTFEK